MNTHLVLKRLAWPYFALSKLRNLYYLLLWLFTATFLTIASGHGIGSGRMELRWTVVSLLLAYVLGLMFIQNPSNIWREENEFEVVIAYISSTVIFGFGMGIVTQLFF